jgi:hypothetical protein
MDNETKLHAIWGSALVVVMATLFAAISHSERLETKIKLSAISQGCNYYPQGIVVCPQTKESK